jgi:glycosyltransferase involved in cell wall biosynthesis
LPKVAHILSRSDRNYLILTTFDASTSRSAAELDKLISHTPSICNIGRVDAKDLTPLYAASSALLLPTLLESYSGCYQESFAAGTPVLTSDLPFTREVCKNAAVYFDPHDPHSIAMAIESLFMDAPLYFHCISEGSELNKKLLTWELIGLSISKLIRSRYL